MTELNQRYLALCAEIIEKYRSGQASYPKLVSRLDEVLCSLESPPQDWFVQVSEKWEHLETINALILSSDDTRKEKEKFSLKVDNLLGELKLLVDNYPLNSGLEA